VKEFDMLRIKQIKLNLEKENLKEYGSSSINKIILFFTENKKEPELGFLVLVLVLVKKTSVLVLVLIKLFI
jgi:hypothetical protein